LVGGSGAAMYNNMYKYLLLFVALICVEPTSASIRKRLKENRLIVYEGKSYKMRFSIMYVLKDGEYSFRAGDLVRSRVYPIRHSTRFYVPISVDFVLGDDDQIMTVTFTGHKRGTKGYLILSVVFKDFPAPTDPSTQPPPDPSTDPTIGDSAADPSLDPATDLPLDPVSDPEIFAESAEPLNEAETTMGMDPPEDPDDESTQGISSDWPDDPLTDPPTDPSEDPSTFEITDHSDPSTEWTVGPYETSIATESSAGSSTGTSSPTESTAAPEESTTWSASTTSGCVEPPNPMKWFCKCKGSDRDEDDSVEHFVKRSTSQVMNWLEDIDDIWRLIMEVLIVIETHLREGLADLFTEENGIELGKYLRDVFMAFFGFRDGLVGMDCVCIQQYDEEENYCPS